MIVEFGLLFSDHTWQEHREVLPDDLTTTEQMEDWALNNLGPQARFDDVVAYCVLNVDPDADQDHRN